MSKRPFIVFTAGLLTAALALLVAGCQSPSMATYREVGGTMLGTSLQLIAATDLPTGELYQACMAIDREAKSSMSIFDKESLLSRINRNETDSVDRHLRFNITLADSISRLSEGCYDITVAPLVKAWGFAGRQADHRPNVDSILAFVGYQKIDIEGDRLRKADERIQIDLNSIAKGYTVDLIAELLIERGVTDFLVDIGGEVRCQGVNRLGGKWRIGIETPFDGNYTDGAYIQRRIALGEGALATSGNYRRFYLDSEGRKVAHTIDPRTGYSKLSKLLSATVVAPTCAEADALCTMLMAMGDQEALRFAEQHPTLPLCLILSGEKADGYDEYISPAMKNLMMD